MKDKEIIPVIVLSTHTIGLAVIRALGMMGVTVIAVYYEKNDMGYVSKYVKENIFSPHPEKYENEFIDLIINCSKRFGRCLLIPADDATLLVVSKHKGILNEYHIVACTEWNITEQFIDKKLTYALAEEIGIPVPKTLVPGSVSDVESYGKNVQYPCLVKPCHSHRYFEYFRKKMVRVDNLEQMIFEYNRAHETGIDVMIQELIPGDDTMGVNYNSYFWNGKPLIEVTAEKVRLAPPGFGVPRVVVSKSIPEIIEPGREILSKLGFYGYSCTEFKKDPRDGIYKFMEVNGRHNRSASLSVRCGVNFPWIMYKHFVHGELPSQPGMPAQGNFQEGVYWIDDVRDVLASLRYYFKERYPIREYARPYLKPHAYTIFDVKDVKPFIKRCFDLAKMAVDRVFSYFNMGSLNISREIKEK